MSNFFRTLIVAMLLAVVSACGGSSSDQPSLSQLAQQRSVAYYNSLKVGALASLAR